MLKKLESTSAPQSFRHTFAAFCFALLCAAPFYGVAQDGEMKQKISAFNGKVLRSVADEEIIYIH